ncbi:YbaB/EbfC family nucleoid-associated protein [Patescibacteria group bacterium]|nr:YbaB/EbfC family nucleoid-associated protein [Patescibacteria group bacterium]MBU1029000.1 YbaB/EbfC family nucleoid-associated protein [Patescibacteria group bacterium]MBU1916108.1 YbaB/EbfC family nucleoid-associated protein [Patescibacteria group bacterium]
MFNKLKQVKDLRDKAKHLQNMLADEKVEGSAAWGKVKIQMNGNQQILNVDVDPELLKESEQNRLQDAIRDACNDAVKKAQRKMVEKMRASGDLNVPGLT